MADPKGAFVVERVTLSSDWQRHIRDGLEEFFASKLGPDILEEARRAVPILTGRLRASLRTEIIRDGDTVELRMGSYPDADGPVDYALAVEFGFHGEEWVRYHIMQLPYPKHGQKLGFAGLRITSVEAHARRGNSPEQPYMRPALYRVRTA